MNKETTIELSFNSNNNKLNYRAELDGLRAIAVLSVIFYHAHFSLFKGGYVGIDVFFVLSGFLMSSIILREKEADKFTLRAFYERRARRILPMLMFTLLTSYMPAYYFMLHNDFVFYAKSAFFSSIAVANIFYSTTTRSYFDTSTDRIPLVHTWTLGVEEQFYVIIPLIFILFWRFGKHFVCGVIAIMAVASFCLTFFDLFNSIEKFYMLFTRFWELAIGSLIVFVPKQAKSEAVSFAGVASILTAVFAFDDKFPDPSLYTLLPTCGTALVILYSSETKIASFLSEKNTVFIGLVSYSAYLIHQPLFALYRIQSIRVSHANDFIVLIIITFLLSYVTWRFVENPFRNKSQVSIIALATVIVAAGLFISFLSFVLVLPVSSSSSSNIRITSSSSNSLVKFKEINIYNRNFTNSSETNGTYQQRSRYIAVFNGTNVPQNYDEFNCHIHHHEKSNENNPLFCRVGLDMFDTPPTYFLTGDSMSKEYTSAFDAIEGSGVFASIGDGCQTSLVRTNSSKMSKRASGGYRCWLFHEHVYNFIKKNATSIRKLLLASQWVEKLDDTSHLDLIYTIQKYAEINVAVYLIEQPPAQFILAPDVIANLQRQKNLTELSIRANSLTLKELLDYDAKRYQPFLKRIQENAPLVHIYTRHYFCDNECCPIGTTNVTFYKDNAHITPARTLVLVKLFLSIV